eukprot:gene19852-23560_t
MASRVIAQMIISGAQIVSRAFITAYQQALRNAKAGGGAAAAGGATGVVRRRLATDEALKILNLERSELTAEAVQKVCDDAAGAVAVSRCLIVLPAVLTQRYDRLYESNSPTKGGSFYLQSKVFRSREALLAELDDIAKGKKDGEIPKQEGSADAD